MIFRVNVANERGRALLDSGASIDFVDRRFVEKLKPKPNKIKQNAQITLGDNSVIKSTEACELTLVINNKSMQGECNMCDMRWSAAYNCVLPPNKSCTLHLHVWVGLWGRRLLVGMWALYMGR